jgi:hypothetical protein
MLAIEVAIMMMIVNLNFGEMLLNVNNVILVIYRRMFVPRTDN